MTREDVTLGVEEADAVLELLTSSSREAYRRVPSAFRPKVIDQNLIEAELILADLRKISPETDSSSSDD